MQKAFDVHPHYFQQQCIYGFTNAYLHPTRAISALLPFQLNGERFINGGHPHKTIRLLTAAQVKAAQQQGYLVQIVKVVKAIYMLVLLHVHLC